MSISEKWRQTGATFCSVFMVIGARRYVLSCTNVLVLVRQMATIHDDSYVTPNPPPWIRHCANACFRVWSGDWMRVRRLGKGSSNITYDYKNSSIENNFLMKFQNFCRKHFLVTRIAGLTATSTTHESLCEPRFSLIFALWAISL